MTSPERVPFKRFRTIFACASLCLGLALTLGACGDRSGGEPGMEQRDTMATVPTDTGGMSSRAEQSVVQTAKQQQNLSQFTKALQTAGLAQSLQKQGPYTIFAPTDSAFQALPPPQRQSLMKPENKQQLRNILTYHVVSGKNMAPADLRRQENLTSMQGGNLQIQQQGQNLMIGNARITLPGMQASNGMIYPIDAVLIPQEDN